MFGEVWLDEGAKLFLRVYAKEPFVRKVAMLARRTALPVYAKDEFGMEKALVGLTPHRGYGVLTFGNAVIGSAIEDFREFTPWPPVWIGLHLPLDPHAFDALGARSEETMICLYVFDGEYLAG